MKKLLSVLLVGCLLITSVFSASVYSESAEDEVFYEGFETLTDITTVIKNGTTSTWPKYEITEEDAATGSKSAKLFIPYNVSYIQLDKSKLVENSEYEFSFKWKMLEYTETKARQLRYLRLAGWNPSTGDLAKNSTNIGGIYTAINATGDWVNTSFKFTISDLDAYEEFIIKFDCGSTPNTTGNSYTKAEDSIYIDDIKLVGEVKEMIEGKVLFESDFDGDTNWYTNNTTRVGYLDDNGDGVTDYAQIHPTKDKAGYLSSTPTTLVPGKEYQLTFYARIPEDSGAYTGEYTATDGTAATYSYAPVFALYQPTVNSEGTQVTDTWKQGQNEYAYKNVRRTDFTSIWQIGDYASYTRNNYSILGGKQHYEACDSKSPNEVYADWTKVTLSFTALDDDTNIGPQVVALSFSLPKAEDADNPLKLDIKDVKFIEKSTEVSDEDGEYPTFAISELAGKYKTQGRASIINDILMVDYSASGIEFSANCEGDVSLTFNATKLKDGDEGGCYFTVIVDGVKKARDFCHITATGDTTVTIAKNLAFGTHTFEIYRQTEIERATVGIKSINLSGELLPAPQYNDMYIEIIGDSAVTAYGNLGENGVVSKESAPLPKYQDVTQGYAYLTARELGADWSIVAQQGRGAKYGFSEENLQDIYPKLRYNKDKNTDYDFAREPDYVIAALGTNDLYTYNKSDYTDPVATLDDVKTGYKEMLALLREKNPNSIIIWAGIDYEPELEVLAKEVVAEAGGELKGYYSVKLTADKLGGNSHPSAASHITMAEELSAFIKEVDEQNNFATGDLDDDGTSNLNDLVGLAQHVAEWENLNIKTLGADTDGNKVVDLNDVTHLAQYLAGWDVELGSGLLDYTSGMTGVVNKKVTNYVSQDGLKIPYTLLVPKNYNKNKEYPVVMFFHGADAKGTTNERPIQKLEPFYDTDAKTMGEAIVLIPQCINKADTATMGPYTNAGWWRYRDDGKSTLDVAMELLENEVLAKYNCDANRFYVMGLSMGGEATWKTLEKYPEKIAAAVPICGSNRGLNLSANDADPFEDATRLKDVPIWMYHGSNDADVLVSVSQSRYDNLIAAGAKNVKFTIYEGLEHDIWDDVAKDSEMIKWLFEQKLH
ncbi:MAG: hypothetical protein E7551_08720 [Ruminococcaceae bacterium]|nr:hypothetical protein [Oscillospiraceae bacterium]